MRQLVLVRGLFLPINGSEETLKMFVSFAYLSSNTRKELAYPKREAICKTSWLGSDVPFYGNKPADHRLNSVSRDCTSQKALIPNAFVFKIVEP